jgi:hypothetical protein
MRPTIALSESQEALIDRASGGLQPRLRSAFKLAVRARLAAANRLSDYDVRRAVDASLSDFAETTRHDDSKRSFLDDRR